MWTQETIQLRTAVCDKRLKVPITPEMSEANISIDIHIQQWLRMDHTSGALELNYSDH